MAATRQKSLSGIWKLIKNGSDIVPAIETLESSPIVLQLTGKAESEFFKIERRAFFSIEEIHLHYCGAKGDLFKSYQFGTASIEHIANDTVLGIIQMCDATFQQLTIARLGPKAGECRLILKLLSHLPQSKVN